MSIRNFFQFWRKDVVAQYHLLQPIAQGGMGTVWKARDEKTNRIVAVKVIRAESSDVVEKMRKIFNAEEGEIALKLHHPNVVETYDKGTFRGQYYTVMEYVPGPNLKLLIIGGDERVKRNRMDICMQIGRGLSYIHQEGLVHRDFCPKNVLYTKEGIAKIIDFGLTIPMDVKQKRGVDQSGTASYMAPEQVRRQRIDVRSDIYAFGVTVFEVMTGRRPFPNNPDSRKKMEHHLNIDPQKLCDVDPSLPKELEGFIEECIQKDPDMRYRSMFDVMRDLRKIEESYPHIGSGAAGTRSEAPADALEAVSPDIPLDVQEQARLKDLRKDIRNYKEERGLLPKDLHELVKFRGEQLPHLPKGYAYQYAADTGQIRVAKG